MRVPPPPVVSHTLEYNGMELGFLYQSRHSVTTHRGQERVNFTIHFRLNGHSAGEVEKALKEDGHVLRGLSHCHDEMDQARVISQCHLSIQGDVGEWGMWAVLLDRWEVEHETFRMLAKGKNF